MNRSIIKIVVALIVVSALTGCSHFSKLLKGNDYELKYTKAFEYYDAKKYDKALQLFEQITPIYRGLDKGEKVMYYYTMCNYLVKDYYSAGYYFRKFAQTYPHSPYNEEAMYMGAYCYYLDSPKPSLDQESTNQAIQEFEMFLSKYPNTSKKDTCNMLLDELRLKLQTKSYDNAFLYYNLGYLKAASIALRNSLDDYPDSPYRESILYYVAKATFMYAEQSVDAKQFERYQDAHTNINAYLKAYPNGKHIKDIRKMRESSDEYIRQHTLAN